MLRPIGITHLLLLHQLGVGAIVDNILAKDGCGQHSVDLLGIDILQLPIEDELIALSAQIHRRLLPQEDKCENITILCTYQSRPFFGIFSRQNTNLCSALEEKFIWVDSVGDGAPNDGKPVEDHRGFVRVFEERLAQDVEHDREGHKCDKRGSQHDAQAALGNQIGERFFNGFEDSHVAGWRHRVVGRGREEEDEEGKVRWKWKWRRIYRDTATVIVRYGREQFYFGRPDPRSRFVLPNGDWLGPGFPGRLAVAALSPPWFVFGF
jgi:hypothetical protein